MQAGGNDTPVDGAHCSSQTGMQIDSMYSSSQSADTDTAAAHILDDHLATVSARIFNSTDPIDLIDTDYLAVDGSVYPDDTTEAYRSQRSPVINGVDDCREDITATQAGGNDTPADGAHCSSQTDMLIDSMYSSSQSAVSTAIE